MKLEDYLSAASVATIISLILAVAGAIVVIVHPATLTFDQYLDEMKFLIGALAIGRGVATAGGRIGYAVATRDQRHR